jgi:hypothetical protein
MMADKRPQPDNEALARKCLGHLGDFKPPQFGSFNLRAVPRDALGQLREAIGVARI